MSANLTTSYWPADPSEPVLETTVGDALRRAAAEHRERTALIEGSPDPGSRRRWSYEDLLADAERVARALPKAAKSKQDFIVLPIAWDRTT